MESGSVKSSKSVKSFAEYKTAKGKQWFSKVKGGRGKGTKTSAADEEVLIYIGLLEWNEKQNALKPKRGKKVALRISTSAKSSLVRQKAEEKWKAYYRNLYEESQTYLLLYEDGQQVLFLPGTSELFSLKRYQEEIGKDYNRIHLYLCTTEDYNNTLDDGDESEDETHSSSKYAKVENETALTKVGEQIQQDEQLARELENQFNQEVLQDQQITENLVVQERIHSLVQQETAAEQSTSGLSTNETILTDHVSVIKELSTRVDNTGQFFMVVRRASSFTRRLNLWQRESKRTSPEKCLRVHFTGEDGIDSGAMSKEFLAQAVLDMGNIMFAGGAPVNSTYNVQNGYFQSCGEIVAVSLAQGGPPPCFLEECVYDTLVNPETDLNNLNEKHITPEERKMLESIQNDLASNYDTIVDHGYTGKIDQEHIGEISGSILISVVTKRQVYLKEFMRGLELYGLAEIIKHNPESCKSLFVRGSVEDVDANYVFSLMKPNFSLEGSSRKEIEESVMDSFQDFLISLEDHEKVTGYAEAVSWNYDENGAGGSEISSPDSTPTEEFQKADITVAGVLSWLTGQSHRPMNGDPLTVYVNFDHECLNRNPKHKICFPCVAACGRELTLPVCHMSDTEEFRKTFILAYSKGQAFSRP